MADVVPLQERHRQSAVEMTQSVREKDWLDSDGVIGSVLPPVRMALANAMKGAA
jgi:hypothetical protein